jgi:purine-binding chemotaxis protein CheW
MESSDEVADAPGAVSEPFRDGVSDACLFGLRIMGGRYAFAASLVMEVVRLGPITRLPAAPSFLRGVFTHRGEVVPVLDIGSLVGKAPIVIGPSTRTAIVRSGPWHVAIVADAVDGLVDVENLEPPLADGGGISAFLAAVGRDSLGSIAVIDLPRLIEAARKRSVPA